jgi:hypothetical protein
MLPWGCCGMWPPTRNFEQRIMEYLWTGKSMALEDCCRSTFDKVTKIFLSGLSYGVLILFGSCHLSHHAAHLGVQLSGTC